MARAPGFEFPAQMQDFADRKVEQARAAWGQFMDAARKAMGFTRQNIDASFC